MREARAVPRRGGRAAGGGATTGVRRNVALLSVCQALFVTSTGLMVSVSALVGYALAARPSLATLPLGLQFLATMVFTVPASLLMKRAGRRFGFAVGALVGAAGAACSALAIVAASFPLFCAGAFLLGIFVAFAHYYRFAAADAAPDGFRARAISLVLAGGVVAAFIGPNLANWTRDLVPTSPFAGSYASLVAVFAGTLALLSFIDMPAPAAHERLEGGRPLARIAREPVFAVAVVGAVVGYGVMNLLMTATPLAMLGCGHGFADTAFVIQWHIVAMFAPSFVTGHLIHRFGELRIMLWGSALLGACVAVNLSGVEVANFGVALALLGLGWNFLFIGATSLLTELHSPAEKAKVQGLNEFLVFGTVTLTATSSGMLHDAFGWSALNVGTLPLLAAVVLATASLARRRARMTPTP